MKGTIVFGVTLALATLSRFFIYTLKRIPLLNQIEGDEPLYAFAGGAALAFATPTLPLLGLYLTVLFSTVDGSLKSERSHENVYPAALFLLAFVAAFVITISGVPLVIAKAIYRGKR